MQASQWITISGIFVSGLIAILSIIISRNQHRDQLVREDKIRDAEYQKEIERDKRHRVDIPQIEFDISCNQIGCQDGQYVVEFLLMLNNKGNVKQDVKSINLRVRSIKRSARLTYWEEDPYRLNFPNKLFETEIIPQKYGFIFVEPNVKQLVSFITKIDSDNRFIVARAEFSYGKTRTDSRGSKHSIERVFQLSPQ